MGFPTQHSGCWLPENVSDELDDDPFLFRCYTDTCFQLSRIWANKVHTRENITWETLLSEHPECAACNIERKRRCRLVEPQDARVLCEPYLSAPYVHQNNQ